MESNDIDGEKACIVSTALDTPSHPENVYLHGDNSRHNACKDRSLLKLLPFNAPIPILKPQYESRSTDFGYCGKGKDDSVDIGCNGHTHNLCQNGHVSKIEAHNSYIGSESNLDTHHQKINERKLDSRSFSNALNYYRAVTIPKVETRPINNKKTPYQPMEYNNHLRQCTARNANFRHSSTGTRSDLYIKRVSDATKLRPQSEIGIGRRFIEENYSYGEDKNIDKKAKYDACVNIAEKPSRVEEYPAFKLPHGNEENKDAFQSLEAHMKSGSKENNTLYAYCPTNASSVADESNKENKKPKFEHKRDDMGLLGILCEASEQLRNQLEKTKSCSCPRSRCIKLYCECFQAGRKCSVNCSCKKCKNTDYESRPEGARTKAIQNLLLRNPNAFKKNKPFPDNHKIRGVFCRCVKSRCLKLYCDCFQSGKFCTSNCLCVECLNQEKESGPTGRRTIARQLCQRRNPYAFEKKVKKIGQGCSCKNSRCLKRYCECFNSGISCSYKCSCVNCGNAGFGAMKTQIQHPNQINDLHKS